MEEIIKYNKYRLWCFRNGVAFEPNEKFEKILNARYHKVGRIKKRITYLLTRYKYNYFCTFTFNDDNIKKCDRTKKDMIKKCLYSFDENIKIILNIDFGKKTEREHYHGIISTNCNLDLNTFLQLTYDNFCSAEKIVIEEKSVDKISKYINKLTNHATKESTRRSRIYYNFKGYDNELQKNSGYSQRELYLIDKIFLGIESPLT